MRLDLYVHLNNEAPPSLADVQRAILNAVTTQGLRIMTALEDLQTAVAVLKTQADQTNAVVATAVTQLDALKAAVLASGTDPAALADLAAQVVAIGAGLTAGTVALGDAEVRDAP